MIRRTTRRSFAVLLLLAIPCFAAAQKVAAPECVPAGVQAFFSITDPNAMWAGYAQSPLAPAIAAALQLPAIQQKPEVAEIGLFLDKAELELGYSVRPADLFGRHLKGLDLYMMGTDDLPANSLVVFRFDEAAKPAALLAYVERQAAAESETRAAAGLPPIEMNRYEVAGTQVVAFTAKRLHLAAKEDLLLVASTAEAIASALDSPGESRLEEVAGLAQAFEALAVPGAQARCFLTREAVIATQQSRGYTTASSETGAIAGAFNMSAARFEASFLAIPPPGRRVDRDLASRSPEPLLRLTSFGGPAPLLALAGSWLEGDLALDRLDQYADADPRAAAKVRGTLSGVESYLASLNLSLREDVLPAFGPECGLYINKVDLSNFMAPNADVLLVLKVRDAEKAARALAAFERGVLQRMAQNAQLTGMPPPASEPAIEQYGDVAIRTIPYAHPMMPVPLAISNATTPDGFLLLTLTTAGMKEALDRSRSSAAAAAASPVPPTPGTTGLAVLDIRQVISVLPVQFFLMSATPEERLAAQRTLEVFQALGTLVVTTALTEQGDRVNGSVVMR